MQFDRRLSCPDLLRALFDGWTWRMAWRDSRTERSRLFLFAASVAVGIGALVAVHALKDSVERAVSLQARSLLGADLQITARAPFTGPEVNEITRIAGSGARIARESGFASMLTMPDGNARLAQVRGLSGGYPFYGDVKTEPAGAWPSMINGEGVLLEGALMDQFKVKRGESVQLGGKSFKVLGRILIGAPRSGRFSGFAPEVYVQLSSLEETGLLAPRSLAYYHLQIKHPEPGLKAELHALFPEENWKFETPEDRQENVSKVLAGFQQFLGILALAAVVLGATGVGGAVHSHVTKRDQSISILRCLGCSSATAFAVYFVQALLLGCCGALLGVLAGCGLHALTVWIFGDAFPVAVPLWPQWGGVLASGFGGVIVCLAFALPPLLKVRRIAPALREPSPSASTSGRVGNLLVLLLLATSVFGLAWQSSADWKRALGLTIGLGIVFGALAGTGWLVMRLARKFLPASWPYLLRQGISNLYRPKNQTLLFLVSLGLGIFLLLTIVSARNLLLQRLELSNAAITPSAFLVDVQPDQREGVEALLKRLDLPLLQSAPMITMRLRAIKGVPVSTLLKQKRDTRRILQREYRSTYRSTLSETEKLVAGEWVAETSGDGVIPVSMEKEIASDLGVGIGDEIELDVQGVTLSARVTSLREVDWSQFGLNFFMVFPPGVLESAPGFHALTTRVSEGQSSGDLQRALAKEFPNISVIDLAQTLEMVRSIFEKIASITQVLSAFSVVAGLLILAGIFINGRDQRLQESVLLRTLGASGAQVRVILIVEYSALGFLAALVGMILAVAANAALAFYVFEASPWPDPLLMLVTPLAAVGISILAGTLFSRRSGLQPPLELLRAR